MTKTDQVVKDSPYRCIFNNSLSKEAIQEQCYRGELRKSVLRSVIWRILLKVLPVSPTEWIDVNTRNRNKYNTLKKRHIVDPHDQEFVQDPQSNNPLTCTEESPWNKFFEDNELREMILKDARRTFPEIPYFQEEAVRTMMVSILQVYAREYPSLAYKQGMHEILAPLLFVLYCDIETFKHTVESDGLKCFPHEKLCILTSVYDENYLEHDAYSMFQEVMMEIGAWYEEGEHHVEKRNLEPFMRLQDSAPMTELMKELGIIGSLLHSVDSQLASYLDRLDIPAQLYGIRWLRLLFGREFNMHDLLYLWDVIFCEKHVVKMVECIFIAMLIHIRELLLGSDYGGCLQYLMRYPPIADITSFVQLSLHYYSPKTIPKPHLSKSSNFANITVAGSSHPNKSRDVVDRERHVMKIVPKQRNNVFDKMKESFREATSPSSPQTTPKKGRVPINNVQVNNLWGNELQLMENQIATLQTRLNDRDMLCSTISKLIEENIEKLPNASSLEDRLAIAENLQLICTRLKGEFVPQVMDPVYSNRIEAAKEVRAPVMRTRRKENEMTELRTNLQM